jgi:hypothetical protein
MIAMRKRLVHEGKSGWCTMEVTEAIKRFEPWLDAYPNATDNQVTRHILRNRNALRVIMPGKQHPAHETYKEELIQIIQTHAPDIRFTPQQGAARRQSA